MDTERGIWNNLFLGIENLAEVEGFAAGDLRIVLFKPIGELFLDRKLAGAAGLKTAFIDQEELA